ncbi:hypothetical protein [uncultured Veillonella sp.]|uniref:hypothetical protein n=1 Tax=uncultured Veillonella sp. TaxID=159268 RepID=UPI0028041EFE|nr:hypothetical protein [uncultured Veillonella sp.]
MREDYREIKEKLNNLLFGFYTLSFIITLISVFFTYHKGLSGAILIIVIYWVGYLIFRYLGRKEISKIFEESELKEQYRRQYQNNENNII